MEIVTVNSVQEAYNLGYKDGFKTANTHVTQTRYVEERTCKLVIKTNKRPGKTAFNLWYACSECEHPANLEDKYCSECGARVTEVE